MNTLLMRSLLAVCCFVCLLCAAPLGAAPTIAWTEANDGVTLANRDGGGATPIVSGLSVGEVQFHPADEDWYWFAVHTIYRADFDGANPQTVLTDNDMYSSAGDFALDTTNGHVYWVNINRELQRAELNGANQTLIRNDVDWNRALGIDPVRGKLFYGRNSPAFDLYLYMSDLDGSNETYLTSVSPTWAVTDIAVDSANGYIYWSESADSANERVRRLGMGPGTPTTLIDAELGKLNDVTLDPDAGKLLMVESAYGRIYQSDLDGSNFETLVDGLSQPRHVAYAPTPEPGTVVLLIAGAAGLLRRRRR